MRALLLAFSSAAALAAEPVAERDVVAAQSPREETGMEADHATGDWGGLRSRWVDRGVHLSAGYTADVLGNVSGGLRRGAAYQGLLELGLELDSDRLGWWRNGQFLVSSLFPHGTGFSSKRAGDILTASNIEAYDSFRLYELWYQHAFLDRQFTLRVGQLVADNEFAFTASGGTFLNSAFGWPAFISANVVNTGPAYFVAAPGVRARWEPTESVYFQTGVYDGDSFDNPGGDPRINASGTRVHLDGEQGLFTLAEAGFLLHPGEKPNGLPGVYKIGGWLHTADADDYFQDFQGGVIARSGLPPRQHSSNFGAYVAAEQRVWREEEDQGISLFARAGFAPRDRSFVEFATDFGVSWIGVLPARDEDEWGVGFVYARLSRDLGRFERMDTELNGASYPAFSSHESVLETFYSIKWNTWWSIQPDFQWIIHPGGTADLSDAYVIGLRTSIIF